MLYPFSLNPDRRVRINGRISILAPIPILQRFYSLRWKCHRFTGSFEHSPRFIEQFQTYLSTEDLAIIPAETQLREDLADAMRESPRDSGERDRHIILCNSCKNRKLLSGSG